MVILFSSFLLSLLIFFLQSSSNDRYAVTRNMGFLQAKIMALSGTQHMLLKVKLFQTELYESAALIKGKNPYFNFEVINGVQPCASSSNPGPRFITHGTLGADTKNEISIDPNDDFSSDPGGGWFSKDGFSQNAWPTITNQPVVNSRIYLWKYCADVTNNSNIQPALIVSPPPGGYKGKGGDPYEGIYKAVSFDVRGQKNLKGYEEDCIYFTVQGTIKDNRGNQYTEQETQTVNITRK